VRRCEQCGAEIVGRPRATVCGPKCSRLRWYYANREQSIATTRAWQAANDEAWRETKRQWGLANRDRKRDALREFYRRNPLAVTVYGNRRRAAKLANSRTAGPTPRDLSRLINRFHGCCAYCGIRPDTTLHIDHVVPLARGGSNDLGNLLPACADCNLSKNQMLLTEWNKRRAYRLAA
jgi:5-methylcytosine-specific restriction endonuclease McrA